MIIAESARDNLGSRLVEVVALWCVQHGTCSWVNSSMKWLCAPTWPAGHSAACDHYHDIIIMTSVLHDYSVCMPIINTLLVFLGLTYRYCLWGGKFMAHNLCSIYYTTNLLGHLQTAKILQYRMQTAILVLETKKSVLPLRKDGGGFVSCGVMTFLKDRPVGRTLKPDFRHSWCFDRSFLICRLFANPKQ